MPLRGECFPAALNRAHEGLLSGVDPLMSFEIPPLCEGFPAPSKLADEGLITGLMREIIG
jgi:hypothetical protein